MPVDILRRFIARLTDAKISGGVLNHLTDGCVVVAIVEPWLRAFIFGNASLDAVPLIIAFASAVEPVFDVGTISIDVARMRFATFINVYAIMPIIDGSIAVVALASVIPG